MSNLKRILISYESNQVKPVFLEDWLAICALTCVDTTELEKSKWCSHSVTIDVLPILSAKLYKKFNIKGTLHEQDKISVLYYSKSLDNTLKLELKSEPCT